MKVRSFGEEEIGPPEVHVASGVIDVLVEDEAEAIAVARKYLAYFGPPATPGEPTPIDPTACGMAVPPAPASHCVPVAAT